MDLQNSPLMRLALRALSVGAIAALTFFGANVASLNLAPEVARGFGMIVGLLLNMLHGGGMVALGASTPSDPDADLREPV